MSRFSTFRDVIDAFGVRALADILRTRDTHIRTMAVRGSIPPDHFLTLVEAAHQRGIEGLTLDALHKLRAERFARSRIAA